MTGAALEALLILLGVIGLLLGVGLWIRRMGGAPLARADLLKVVSGMRLGTRERLLVLEIEQQWIVVGVSPAGMQTLHTLPKPATPPVNVPPQEPLFAHWLKKLVLHRNA